MPISITARKGEAKKAIEGITQYIRNPLYRGLWGQSLSEYKQKGVLSPKDGSLSVGRGVFFTNSIDAALDFAEEGGFLLVTSMGVLDPEGKAIDTRVEGYDQEIIKKLDSLPGKGSYSCWRLWEEVQKSDTLTYEGGPKWAYTYTKREPVVEDRILLEVAILAKEAEEAESKVPQMAEKRVLLEARI